MFTEAEKAQIRRYMGRAPLGVQFDQSLEGAMDTIGGLTESLAYARVLLTDLATVETNLKAQWDTLEAHKVDEIMVDSARAIAMLRSEGNRLARQLGDLLNTRPRRNVFFG